MSDQLIVVNRSHGSDVEAEPVVVNTDNPDTLVLVLDDGETLEFDRRELLAAAGEIPLAA